jgi:D-alanine-D-alanine ligase
VQALRSRGHEVVSVDGERGVLSAADELQTFARRIDRAPPPLTRGSRLPYVVADLKDGHFDVVFLAMHGGTGEDGTLQALLDLHGFCYTGSPRLGSSLAWHKAVSKQLFTLAGIPTPAWRRAPVSTESIASELGFPVIVKPAGQGSTVGLTLVEDAAGIDAAVALAARYDTDVLVERYIAGRELTVGVLGDRALAVGEIVPTEGKIFDYAAKYQPEAAAEIFPADIADELAGEVQRMGLAAHAALGLTDYSRADFRLDAEGGLWCLEVNTLPGMSTGSLLPKSAAAAGIAFDDLCERICKAAVARARA